MVVVEAFRYLSPPNVEELVVVSAHSLPKAELHLHIEGSLEPELVFELAERNGVVLPWSDVTQLRGLYDFENLGQFLDLYYQCMAVLRTADDFRLLAQRYFERAAADGVCHAELFFDPQAHTSRGVDINDVIDGLLAGLAWAKDSLGITGGLILCFLRDVSVDSAAQTLESVVHRVDDLLGVGLDSAEVGFPPELFTGVFDRARDLGLRLVSHAGEEGGPEYVWQALNLLGVERVDHGVRSIEDPGLVSYLVEHEVPLTVCPLSNQRLQVTPDLADHPLKKLLDAGVVATVNSDDPAYFGGYVGENYTRIAEALNLSDTELVTLARNSIVASFASEDRKAELLSRFV